MKSVIKLITLIFASLALFSCVHEPAEPQSTEVKFISSIDTRAKYGQWDDGDAIGLTMLSSDGSSVINNVVNYQFNTDGSGTFSPASQSKRIYLPQDGSNVTFKAYYPYLPSLKSDLVYPINVQSENQKKLSQIDLMATDSNVQYSKSNNTVELVFKHQLTFIEFRLKVAEGHDVIKLDEIDLTIKGMNTKANFSIRDCNLLSIDESSKMDINIPMAADAPYETLENRRKAIVLPRAAGAGIEFEFKSSGIENGSYRVAMKDDLELKAGYKYVMDVTLKKTEAQMSVTIEDWKDGETSALSPVMINKIDAGANVNVNDGDKITLYTKDNKTNEWVTGEFEYVGGLWKVNKALYWEDLNPQATFYASMDGDMIDEDKEKTPYFQVRDFLLADPVTVNANEGVNLVLKHRVAKVVAKITSSDSTFSNTEIDQMVVKLPNYVTGAKYANGSISMEGDFADILFYDEDITVNSKLYPMIAHIQPQKTKAFEKIATVEFNGYMYEVTSNADITFDAGKITMLDIDMKKTGVGISAEIVDWVEGQTIYSNPVMINAESADPSINIAEGTKMTVYTNDTNNSTLKTAEYVYTAGNWDSVAPIDWSDLKQTATFWASIEGDMVDPVIVTTNKQVMDYLLSDDVTVNSGQAINFVLKHKVAKAVIRLVSTSATGSFTGAELAGMVVTLPSYKTGATYTNGKISAFGSSTADIAPIKRAWTASNSDVYSLMAFVEPQTIVVGDVVAKVTHNGNTYDAKYNAVTNYEAGKVTMITLDMNKSGAGISAEMVDWSEGDDVVLTPVMVGNVNLDSTNLPTPSSITISVKDKNSDWKQSVYTWDGTNWSSASPIFWEELNATSTFYAHMDGDMVSDAVVATNNQVKDYLLATPITVSSSNRALNFKLEHKVAWVALQLKSSDNTYNAAQLAAIANTAKLPGASGYLTGATYDGYGSITMGTDNTKDITFIAKPSSVAGAGYTMAAFIQPQTITSGKVVISLTHNSYTYEATSTSSIKFEAGKVAKLEVDLTATNVGISAQYIDWAKGDEVSLLAKRFNINNTLGITSDFFKDKKVWIHNTNDTRGATNLWNEEFEYKQVDGSYKWISTNILYWDDMLLPLTLNAFYYPSAIPVHDVTTSKTFNVTLPTDQKLIALDNYDLLTTGAMSTISNDSDVNNLNLPFEHAFSTLTVLLKPGEGFGVDDLVGTEVVLPDYLTTGTVDMTRSYASGVVTNQTDLADVTSKPIGKTSDNLYVKYLSIMMPQTKAANSVLVELKIPGYTSYTFEGTITSAFNLRAGQNATLTLTVQKTKLGVSATVTDWKDGDKGSIIIE